MPAGRCILRTSTVGFSIRPSILLTGAGFSYNWGAWLASELEGDILTRLASHAAIRKLVQSSGNYEEALEKARSPGYSGTGLSTEQMKILEGAIKGSFWAMNMALGQLDSMEFSDDAQRSIQRFLARFDAIFTLNQDLLLEFHYQPHRLPDANWLGTYYPGLDPQVLPTIDAGEVIRLERRVRIGQRPEPNRQPIFKLHGSVEWQDETGDLFVVGGGKEQYINSKPILRGYFDVFREYLRTPNTRLMTIGYGWADDHVNKILTDASEANSSLSVFHVHPKGREAVHRNQRERVAIYTVPATANLPCIGESRRALSSTFDHDTLEYEKLMRFFA